MTQGLSIALDFSTGQSLAQYLHAVNSAPVLSADEERALARRYHGDNDLDAARQLVLSHLRYVVRVARGFTGYGLPLADLIQEGNIGLMKAVKRFDPEREVRLVSFAVHWVRAEIYDYVLRNWRIVKVATTKAQRKLFFNLRKGKSRLGWMKGSEIEAMADNLSVDAATVREMESRMVNADVPFDADDRDDGDGAPLAPVHYLADMRYNPERLLGDLDWALNRREQLDEALAALDKRSQAVIRRRWLGQDGKATLQELADEYGVSAERIRQIEKQAMGRMRDTLAA